MELEVAQAIGHKSQIRLITTKEGLSVLQRLNVFINDDFLQVILKKATINKTFGQVIYLGWNDVNLSKESLLKDAMIDLEEHDISYTLSIIGESTEEEELNLHYESKTKEIKSLPFPSIIYTFDEKNMEEQLQYYEKHSKGTKQTEEIEYE